jgi:hypothetical protein
VHALCSSPAQAQAQAPLLGRLRAITLASHPLLLQEDVAELAAAWCCAARTRSGAAAAVAAASTDSLRGGGDRTSEASQLGRSADAGSRSGSIGTGDVPPPPLVRRALRVVRCKLLSGMAGPPGGRGRGREHLGAAAAVEAACQQPGVDVMVSDLHAARC